MTEEKRRRIQVASRRWELMCEQARLDEIDSLVQTLHLSEKEVVRIWDGER